MARGIYKKRNDSESKIPNERFTKNNIVGRPREGYKKNLSDIGNIAELGICHLTFVLSLQLTIQKS